MLDALLRLFFPERCAGCQCWGALFCTTCQQQLTPYTTPLLVHSAALNAVSIGYVFEGRLRAAIHTLKYHRRRAMAAPLATLLSRQVRMDSAGVDAVLMGVPLHPRREAERGFNQAHELAAGVATAVGVPVMRGALVRVRDTGQQARLTARERRTNMDGAFRWQGRQTPRSVILIDDVVTTGATFEACAVALRAAGVQRVYGAALARSRGETQARPDQ